ncbi:MAG: hypothetical protein HOP02_07970 [Methylococcaceae bacterium]|nr:hypothetical protein [Methylococcaceae bacterium]
MQAIELPADIDQNHQIHLQLPKTINARKAKVIVMYEEAILPFKPITPGLFKGKMANSTPKCNSSIHAACRLSSPKNTE